MSTVSINPPPANDPNARSLHSQSRLFTSHSLDSGSRYNNSLGIPLRGNMCDNESRTPSVSVYMMSETEPSSRYWGVGLCAYLSVTQKSMGSRDPRSSDSSLGLITQRYLFGQLMRPGVTGIDVLPGSLSRRIPKILRFYSSTYLSSNRVRTVKSW